MKLNVPTLAEVAASRKGPLLKGTSRLEQKTAVKKLVTVTDAQFRQIVFDRDQGRCRCCQRKVVKTLEHVPERCEIHHCHGRRGVLRHEDRAALCLCNSCHEKVTGRVNEKLIIVPTQTFTLASLGAQALTDARRPVQFERIV